MICGQEDPQNYSVRQKSVSEEQRTTERGLCEEEISSQFWLVIVSCLRLLTCYICDDLTYSVMNLSFAGCGFLGIYHVGVAGCFKKYAPHLLLDKISGASAGAIAACSLLCDLPLG